MPDPRVQKLARVLVRYSLALKEGQLFRIAAPAAAAPLVIELVREALLAGAHPLPRITLEGVDEVLYRYGSDAQVRFVPQVLRQEVEDMDATVSILASENTRALSGADPQKVAARRQALREIQQRIMERAAEDRLNWCVTLYPTNAAAQDADMSLADYEEFVYTACKLHEEDPVAAWVATRDAQQRIADFLGAAREIRLVAQDTDLTYRVGGRRWINCYGDKNFPDGEVFTGPEEASAEGHIRYTFPAIYMGREVSDVRLWFAGGRVVKATAAKGEELLHSLLDMDEGARRLGEVAFGTNYNIQRFSRNILFDEKIGGTVHLALGAGYPETGSTNRSALHWDMICDMRQGGEAYADGKLFYKDGKFLI
ncbi:MAG TPA: aminopeptidase [Roseiflexaceae bacterium]|nr:aminopeptidase [Roseiflexaceae bacterium]